MSVVELITGNISLFGGKSQGKHMEFYLDWSVVTLSVTKCC